MNIQKLQSLGLTWLLYCCFHSSIAASVTSLEGPVRCIGSSLSRGEELVRREYLCPLDVNAAFRRERRQLFGLDATGRLILAFNGNLYSVTGEDKDVFGDRLVLEQGSGLLQLYNGTSVVWTASNDRRNENLRENCVGDSFEMKSSGYHLLQQNNKNKKNDNSFSKQDQEEEQEIAWYIGIRGKTYGCHPSTTLEELNQCSHVSTKGGQNICQIRLADHFRRLYSKLQAIRVTPQQYFLRGNVDNQCGYEERNATVVVDTDTGVIYDPGQRAMGALPCEMYLNRCKYKPTQGDLVLTLFDDVDRPPCTDFAKSLIHCGITRGGNVYNYRPPSCFE